jgi:flagellar motor switch protein FliN/FliY
MNPAPRTMEVTPTLDVLMDVELPLTLRFGSTHLAFGEVMGLNTGSLIEFGGTAESPVELLVNGHVVARGEMVMVQGNYGIRITEIASRHERSNAAVDESPAE